MEKTEEMGTLILHPNFAVMNVYCHICNLQGEISTFNRFVNSLTKARFFCESCKLMIPNRINVDLTYCPELTGYPYIPTGIIKWLSRKT